MLVWVCVDIEVGLCVSCSPRDTDADPDVDGAMEVDSSEEENPSQAVAKSFSENLDLMLTKFRETEQMI